MLIGVLLLILIGWKVVSAQMRIVSIPENTCQKLIIGQTKYSCYEHYFRNIVDHQGADVSLAELSQLQQKDSFVNTTCHELTHVIGREAYVRYGSVTEATKYGNSMCYDGYYHGVMESYMSQFDDKKLLALMPSICQKDPSGRYTQAYYDCIHGLGHGVTIRFNNDIFKALPYCDALKSSWEISGCDNGVFMQNILVDGVSHKSIDLKADDPVYPCDAVSERQKDPCYLIQTSHILDVEHNDVAKAFTICDGVESKYIPTCYQSMGRDISSLTNGVPNNVVHLCNLGKPEYQGACYAGAAADAVYKNQRPEDADPLCQAVPQQYQKVCNVGKQAAASLQ